ncbi:hypothetical protein [Thioalkalivibrio sp. ALJ16]|uniref:hypothetical protein n=1 Tax=Thioalkalivibrio sp. ALJ16 TaxID=1158762 RepID=UPI0003607F4D|nr:hypothetical protein [Thioalkalivibrio sp. ALJ16]
MRRFNRILGLSVGGLGVAFVLIGCGDDAPSEDERSAEVSCAELEMKLEETEAELQQLKDRLREEDEALQGLLR